MRDLILCTRVRLTRFFTEIVFYQSTAIIRPLLNVRLLHVAPSFAILGFPHPAATRCPPKVTSPTCSKTSYTTLSQMRSPLQDTSSPTLVESTTILTSPLPLQRPNCLAII